FDAIPLVYERAFGGPSYARNPAGAGHGPDAVLLPNVEDPSALIKTDRDAPAPAGLAGIPMGWEARRSKQGAHDAGWKGSRWPYFPADFDWTCFQAAPPAQQLAALEGGETFAITGMDPSAPVIEGTLPRLRPRCFAQRTSRHGGAFLEVPLRLDTVVFDVDE